MHNKKSGRKILLIFIIIILALIVFFLLYAGKYYHADQTALSELTSDETVTVTKTNYGWLFDGTSAHSSLIFYPGAKVETEAYAPLLSLLAKEGMDVCLVDMPFRFAFFGLNKAEKILSEYDYENWYIGGHSLGGAMAAVFASKHGEELDGLILLAAYPTKPLDEDLLEITLYGSEDEVVNLQKIEDGRKFSTSNSVEYVIEGGNHAQFGNYGIQSGDGVAEISADEQQEQTVKVILEAIANP